MAQTKTTKKKTTTKEVKKTKTPKVTESKSTKKVNNSTPRKTAKEKLAIRKSHNFILILSILGLLCMYISNILGIIITLAAFALSVVELKANTLKITVAFIISAIASIVFVVTYTNAEIDEGNSTNDISGICKTEERLYEENAPLLVDSNSIFEDGVTTITKTDLENYLIDNLNSKCDGYVKIYKDDNDTLNYDAYVKCKKGKYTCQTDGYSE